jgi:predicted phosphodiesterase
MSDRAKALAHDLTVERIAAEARRYKAAYRAALKATASTERLLGMLRESIQSSAAWPPGALSMPPRRRRGRIVEDVPLLLFSDLQIGEVIHAESTHGINRYDFDVFQARLEWLEDRVVDILTVHQRGGFRKLVVASLGDNISGLIHEELEQGDAQALVDQIYVGAQAVSLFFTRLRKRLGLPIEIVAVSGNHGRIKAVPRRTYKRAAVNFDYLFNGIVSTMLKPVPGVTMRVPRSLFDVVEVAGHRVLVSHGHELPPSPLGIPLYSISRASASYQELLAAAKGGRYDYWVMGHFHRPMELDSACVNGTFAGLSEIGIGRFKPIRPMQRLIGFHPRHGKAWEYPIWLDAAPEPRVYRFGREAELA